MLVHWQIRRLVRACFLIHWQMSSHCAHLAEGTREHSGVSFVRALIPFVRAPPLRPDHPPKAHLQILSPWRLGHHRWIWGEHKYSVYSFRPAWQFCENNAYTCDSNIMIFLNLLEIIHLNKRFSHQNCYQGRPLFKERCYYSDILWTLDLFLGFFVCVLGPHPWHMEVPRLGVKLELQLLACTTATAMQGPSCTCNLHHSWWEALRTW